MKEFKELLTKVSPLPWTDETGNVDGAVSFVDPQLNRPMNLCTKDVEGYFRLNKVEDAAFVTRLANSAEDIVKLIEALDKLNSLPMEVEVLVDLIKESLESI